eukprot:6186121-Pleurochrysis_carterae.AAC.1
MLIKHQIRVSRSACPAGVNTVKSEYLSKRECGWRQVARRDLAHRSGRSTREDEASMRAKASFRRSSRLFEGDGLEPDRLRRHHGHRHRLRAAEAALKIAVTCAPANDCYKQARHPSQLQTQRKVT